jgi:hypothetical protein
MSRRKRSRRRQDHREVTAPTQASKSQPFTRDWDAYYYGWGLTTPEEIAAIALEHFGANYYCVGDAKLAK